MGRLGVRLAELLGGALFAGLSMFAGLLVFLYNIYRTMLSPVGKPAGLSQAPSGNYATA